MSPCMSPCNLAVLGLICANQLCTSVRRSRRPGRLEGSGEVGLAADDSPDKEVIQ